MAKVSEKLHLHNRNGTWYYRRRVPTGAAATLKRKVIFDTLGTSSLSEAKKLRAIRDVEWDARFEAAAKGQLSSGDIHPPSVPAAPQIPLAEFTEVVRRYVARQDRKAAANYVANGPDSAAERRDMKADAEFDQQVLRTSEDPNRAVTIQGIGKRLIEQGGLAQGQFGAEWEELVFRALLELNRRKIARLDDDHSRTFFDALFDPQRPPSTTFGELSDRHLVLEEEEARANGQAEKSIDKTRANVALIREIVGRDTLVASIDWDRCMAVRATLARVPAHLNKRYGKLPLERAIEQAANEGRELLGPVTQGQYLAAFRDILGLAVKKRLLPNNPAEGIRPLKRDDVPLAEKRDPFTPEQIATFFQSDFYRSCSASGSNPYRFDRRGGWQFWLPLLCLFTGLRPNEVCQARVGDVRPTSTGTWYIDVAASDAGDEGMRKTLKTRSSQRRIPLHPELERTGFVHFVDARRKTSSSGQLFDLRPDRYGNLASYPLRWFREHHLEKVLNLGERQTFYSFRHSFRDALRRIEATPDVLLALGWSQGDRVVSDDYGSRLDPDQLAPHIRMIAFPGLDLSHLYVKG